MTMMLNLSNRDVRNFLKIISELGSSKLTDISKHNKLRISNLIAFFSCSTVVVYFPYYVLTNVVGFGFILFLTILLINGLGLILNFFGHFSLGRAFIVSSALISVTMDSFAFGAQKNTNIYFFSIMVGLFIIFDWKEKRQIFIFASLLLAIRILLQLHYADPFFPLMPIEQNIYYKIVDILVAYSLSFFLLVKLVSELSNFQMRAIEAAKMRSLVQLAGGVAHEVNNPLAIILGKSEKIKDLLKTSPHAQDCDPHLQKINESVQRISKIVSGLRDFSKNSHDAPLIKIKACELIDSSMSLTRSRAEKCNCSIIVSCDKNVFLVCRAQQIINVLFHLLSNALDEVEQLENRWIKIDVETVGSLCHISVTDSGRGISSEILEKIMDPFFSTKNHLRASGLGLSISKGIIEAHGGELWYDAAAENTKFTFSLTRASESSAPKEI